MRIITERALRQARLIVIVNTHHPRSTSVFGAIFVPVFRALTRCGVFPRPSFRSYAYADRNIQGFGANVLRIWGENNILCAVVLEYWADQAIIAPSLLLFRARVKT